MKRAGASGTVRRRKNRLAGLLLGAALTFAGLVGGAEARTVKIISADTLELRQLDGQEIVLISGAQESGGVELRVDDDIVKALRVEYNRTRRTLTLVGKASYFSASDAQTLTGENLVVDLGTEELTGQDVLISDADLEIRGSEVDRIPGQLRASNGYFTPCAKCGRTPNDYAFRAERLIVYPGDRLVAYRAQLLLADFPVLYLPVLVLPLNDPERQPRLSIGQAAQDGYTVEADLPFSIGSTTLGTTLLRYYQNRNPSFGVGVSLRSYQPLPFIDRLNLYVLNNPRPFLADGTLQPGTDLDINFSAKGRIPLVTAVRDLDYSLSVTRSDLGRASTDPERGVTNVNFGVNVEYPLFSGQFNYVDRYGPEGVTRLTTPLKQPEVVIDPKPYVQGGLSADFKFTVGQYTGQSNPLSRSATLQGINISTSRLEEQHTLGYTAKPWTNADLTLSNTFTGRYYGTGARTVQLNLGAQLTQRWNTTNTFTVSGAYTRIEGTSPFAFDALSGRRVSAPIGLTVNTVPVKDVTFGVSLTRDLMLGPEAQAPANFNLSVNRVPLSASASLSHNFYTGVVESANYSITLSDPRTDEQIAAANRANASQTSSGQTNTGQSQAVPTASQIPANSGAAQTGTAQTGTGAGSSASGTAADGTATTAAQTTAAQTTAAQTTATQTTSSQTTTTPPAASSTATTSTPVTPPAPPPIRRLWPAPNLALSATGGYTRSGGYSPFTVRATVTGDVRTNNFNVFVTHAVQTPNISAIGAEFNATGTRDTVLNPFTVSARETLTFPTDAATLSAQATPRLNGSASVTWRGAYTLSTTHDLLINQPANVKESGTVSFSVGTVAGQATNWQVTYGGPFDVARFGFTRPSLNASLRTSRPGQSIGATALFNVKGLDQQRTELARADLTANWQFGTRFSLSGTANYSRTRTGTFPDDKATDSLTLNPLRLGLALGNGPKPGAYLTASLRQTFTWQDGVRLNPTPLAPVIGLTIDRCCWALQAEIDLSIQRYRLAIGLPGSTNYPLFDIGSGGLTPLPTLLPGVR
ncbi:LPS-assembly protein LptD [Deinococcus puniceus]|uniref:LPS-assembly protein LptD n=1 Tax=Deinococcus puniceus TaxID=1182568 RepID=A0A172TBG2_9DEIO|nr:hypothetical protein [Deinococcus puniceus]ANE44312.1 hypothetical protein SU48_11670 [Deinococcus puniceus]